MTQLRVPPSQCALMHLPGKPWEKLQMIPRSAITQLTEQDLAEELQDRSFSFHAGVDTAVAVQCLLAAMGPSWNRNTVIEKHYPEHLDLLSASGDPSSAAKPAAAAETSSGGNAST